jgi:hypothetical protein
MRRSLLKRFNGMAIAGGDPTDGIGIVIMGIAITVSEITVGHRGTITVVMTDPKRPP